MEQKRESSRRIGSERSKSRAAILAGAITVLQEKGASALTAHQVALAAGVKPPLVHYYFRSIDHLVLELVKTLKAAGVEAMSRAGEMPDPLRALWDLESASGGIGVAVQELATLAYHQDDARAELKQSVEEIRRVQAEGIARSFADRGIESDFSPLAITVILAAVARQIMREQSYGVSLGHAETVAAVEELLTRYVNPG